MTVEWFGDPDGAVIGGADGAILSIGTGAVTFADAEVAIKAHIVEQWAQSVYSAVPVLWENDNTNPHPTPDTFLYIAIEPNYSKKSVYGSRYMRFAQEYGHVFIHAFVPQGIGKNLPNALVSIMIQCLELQDIPTGIKMDGGNAASPADPGDPLIPDMQPGGNYYRVTGSVPFVVISTV